MSKKEKLPVPTLIVPYNLCPPEDEKAANTDTVGEDGKIRSFPHVRGNWASFVYIPVSECNEIKSLVCLIRDAYDDFSVDIPTINFDMDCHVSLTRTQVFRHHWIDSFWMDLNKKLKHYDKFDLVLDMFEAYTNDEKTRTFLAIKLHLTESLLRLIKDCDACLTEYGLQTYYDDPSIHISLAWSSGDQSTWMKKNLLPLLNVKLEELCDKDSSINFVSVERIEFKTGNKIYEFSL